MPSFINFNLGLWLKTSVGAQLRALGINQGMFEMAQSLVLYIWGGGGG